MRLRQLWRNNKLVGLKLDKSSQEFIDLAERDVNMFINHINKQIELNCAKPTR